jgi:hypothetical protein
MPAQRATRRAAEMARVSPSSWAGIERHQKPAMTVIDGDAVCSPHALVKASSCLPP